MPDIRQEEPEIDLLSSVWDPQADQRCIVCGQPSGGKAICANERCAEELAQG